MKILIITNSYPPEIRSTSHLMYELAQDLNEKGHRVTVLTSFPGYNLADPNDSSGLSEVEDENGILVLRARTMPLKKVNYLRRGMAELALPYNFHKLLAKSDELRTFDAVWVFSPPLPLGLLGGWIRRLSSCPLLLNAQDIFPQNGIDLGIITNPAVIRWYEFLEGIVYRLSDFILVHSEHNRDFLIKKKHIPAAKVITQYNWVDAEPFEQAGRTGRFRDRFGIKAQTIVLFAGVMGPSQGLEAAIHLAEFFRDDDSLQFLLVGDGTEKEKLQAMTQERNLSNVTFGPFVSRDDYPFLVKDSDIGLTCLSADVKTPVVPGKIQGYMAAGIPILGVLNKESDGHQLIQEAGAGISVDAGDHSAAAEALYKLKSDPQLRKQMGEAGFRFMQAKLDRSKCVDNILSIIENAQT